MNGNKEDLRNYWIKGGVIKDTSLIEAFEKIDRSDFIRAEDIGSVYGDHPLPIGSGQTISQPTTVMMMLQWLELKPDNSVLEIGAGSGYNAAIISQLVEKVLTIERVPDLVTFARNNLKRSGISNVKVILGDGKVGSAESALYDRIIITAAAVKIPEKLLGQLKVGGILLTPLGPTYGCEMTKITKIDADKYRRQKLGLFSFVPLV
ncbi:MAG: protein-L-isoaspartate(D-aspartate) O-methyltransferase [Proteobacteria bacterium]|nr:protein-L-isoaspartate(D-aspartate) O-methyltransferase [Pseudomonadota bacterium]